MYFPGDIKSWQRTPETLVKPISVSFPVLDKSMKMRVVPVFSNIQITRQHRKMKNQIKMSQTKEKDKPPKSYLNELELCDFPDTELKCFS